MKSDRSYKVMSFNSQSVGGSRQNLTSEQVSRKSTIMKKNSVDLQSRSGKKIMHFGGSADSATVSAFGMTM